MCLWFHVWRLLLSLFDPPLSFWCCVSLLWHFLWIFTYILFNICNIYFEQMVDKILSWLTTLILTFELFRFIWLCSLDSCAATKNTSLFFVVLWNRWVYSDLFQNRILLGNELRDVRSVARYIIRSVEYLNDSNGLRGAGSVAYYNTRSVQHRNDASMVVSSSSGTTERISYSLLTKWYMFLYWIKSAFSSSSSSSFFSSILFFF